MILPLILLAAQVPVPLGGVVTLTWPDGCGQAAGCGYYVSRIAVKAGTLKCPTANTGYTPMNYGKPATALVFIDPTASKLTVCYVVQTTSGGVTTKDTSPPAGPFVVP